jgi:AcrR family transcriptional regulator
MPRAGLDPAAVVAAASVLADADGLDQLTLARLAERLGVRAPSLYAHVGGLADLRARLAAEAARELHAALAGAAAGRAGGDALRAVADAYRAFAHAHPGLYAALQRAQELGEPAASYAVAVVDVFVAVLRGYGLEADEAIHAVRIVRSALHGFVALEAGGGFALRLSLDDTWDRLVALLDRGLAGAAGSGSGPPAGR